MTGMRINKTWLKTSQIDQRIKNRVRRSKADASNYFQPEFVKYKFNEEGA